ncbi:MAG: hypothetical protein EOP93_16410, partial [Lysobacteraceae bacterium]
MNGIIPLEGRTGAVVVLDATGVIGRGLLGAALDAGHPVVAVAGNPASLATLRAEHSNRALTVLA